MMGGQTGKVHNKGFSFMHSQSIDCAIILAGGKGRRMGPLYKDCQKCMILIKGRPLLDYVVQEALSAGCSHLIFVTNHLNQQVEEYANSIKWNCTISIVRTQANGTAGALFSAYDMISSKDFLYLHGDMYYERNLLTDLKDSWQKDKMRSIVAVSDLKLASTHPYIEIDKKNVILNKVSKINQIYFPSNGDSVPSFAYCSMEVMILSKHIFSELATIDKNSMLAEAINKNLQYAYAYLYLGEWFHLETSTDLDYKDKVNLFE